MTVWMSGIFSCSVVFAQVLPSPVKPALQTPSSAAAFQTAQSLIDQKNAIQTFVTPTPAPKPAAAAVTTQSDPYPTSVTLTYSSAGKITVAAWLSYSGADNRTEYTYNSSGMLTQIKETVSEQGVATTTVRGYGLDSKGHYVMFWKVVDTANHNIVDAQGNPYTTHQVLNYNYWYDASGKRNFQAKDASTGVLVDTGYDMLDSQGRVTSSYSRHQADGQVTRKTFGYSTQNGVQNVTKTTWLNSASTAYAPDDVRVYRVLHGIQLLSQETVNSFYGSRSQLSSSYATNYSYPS